MKNSLILRFASTLLLSGFLLAGFAISDAYADTTALAYDPAGNITSRTSPTGTTTYTYDALNRLGSESGPAGTQSYAYDANGNRLSDGSGSYSYSATSNRMATRKGLPVTVDAAGNITADGLGHTFVYNQTGRLAQVLNGTTLLASYYYNYKGERTRKVTTAAAPQGAQTVIYHYDEASHLIGESSGTGSPLRTYIWRDDTPLAQIDYVPSRRVIYFDVDHLNTPRAARDQAGVVVWRWEGDAFGAIQPNQNPSGKGIVTVNLRFPGQYFDQESGLSYNINRDYDPSTGRYVESDPIGLMGGLNTYTYVENNPLSYVDPWGLILQYADPASDKALRPSVQQMMTTPKGRELLKKLNDDPQTFLIHSGFGPHGSNYQLGQDVYVDPNANINIPATDCVPQGAKKFSTTRILAHELGHFTGTLDDGPNNMNNVNKWENSIMFPIEGYNRTRY